MDNFNEQEEIFSNKVRAGKRTYFFDVRATKSLDYYLTITESKKTYNDDGSHFFKKHKIFLYKEDFNTFSGLFKKYISFLRGNKDKKEKNRRLD